MKMLGLPLALLLTLGLIAGCTGKPKARGQAESTQPALTPQEILTQQAIDQFNQASDVMVSIRDREGAAAAAPKLKTIARQLLELNRRGVPMGGQINENPRALGRFKSDMEKATQRYADLAVRMLAQENALGSEFQEALREFGKLPQ